MRRAPPVSAWLSDAYPESSPTGSVFLSAFTTKTMISQAAANQGLVWVYYILAAASAGVFLHAGIKFPWFVFFQKDSGLRPKDAPWNMAIAMVFFAVLCILFGVARCSVLQTACWPGSLRQARYWPAGGIDFCRERSIAGAAILAWSQATAVNTSKR